MTDHPCKGMTDVQIEAFEQIAIGLDPCAGPKTIKSLIDRGLIVQLPDKVIRSAMGPIHIAQYEVPTPIHIQWCQWASEQP